jgi:nitroreductase
VTIIWMLLAVVAAWVAVHFAWRWGSHRWSLPCPTFLAWSLENPCFQRLSGTETTLHRIGFRPGQRILEMGPGPGRLLLPAAQRILPGGEAVGIDIQPGMIERLKVRANKAGVTNLTAKELYRRLKLEGIVEAPLNLAVTCDRGRDAPFVLGRASMPETDLFSTCLAIQNLWLAARAEGVGVGWVSILAREATEQLLGLPDGARLVAYLCVGYPVEFRPRPMLEEVGWKGRLRLDGLVFQDRWGVPAALFEPPSG